jgi:hypothetical protein
MWRSEEAMIRKEVMTLCLWLAFCLFICVESWRLGLGSFKMPGPGLIPFGAALSTGLVTLVLLFQEKLKGTIKQASPFFQGKRVKKVIYMVFGLFLYPVLLSQIGFFLSTLFFVGFSLVVIEPQRGRIALAVSIGAAIVYYLLFDVLLRIQLPRGMLIEKLF